MQVSMRACARDVGLLAIQAALVERCREEDLGAERKAMLAALAAPGGRSVRDIAAGMWLLLLGHADQSICKELTLLLKY
jgi:hypothetical protein